MRFFWQLVIFAAALAAGTVLHAQGATWTNLAVAGGGGTSGSGSAYPTDIANGWLYNQVVVGTLNNAFHYGSHLLFAYGGSDVFVASIGDNGLWNWAVNAGGTGTDYGKAVTTDVLGNIYITGSFTGTAYFGDFSLTSAGGTDILIAKLSPDGTWLWANRYGGAGEDVGTDIYKSLNGSLWAAGLYSGNVSFGAIVLNQIGLSDMYAVKLNLNGTVLAANRAGTSLSDTEPCITADDSDRAWLSGGFKGTLTFPRQPLAPDLTLTSDGNTYTDVFVANLSSSAAWQWATRGGGNSLDRSYAIATNGSGNVWITGQVSGNATFGSFSLTSTGSYLLEDVLIAKMNASGTWVWAKKGGSDRWDEGLNIEVDTMGNSYVSGTYRGLGYFGDVILGFPPNGADSHGFVVRLDYFGNYVWGLRTAGLYYETGAGICLSPPTASVWVCGTFYGSLNLGSLYEEISYSANTYVGMISNGAQIPATPTNLQLQVFSDQPGAPPGNSYILTWNPVTLDTGGYSLLPNVVTYTVWACFENDPYGDYEFASFAPSNSYERFWTSTSPMPRYFRVKAVIDDTPRGD